MGKSVKSGTVKRVLNESRVVVETDAGEYCTIQQEAFAPGVPLSWIFQVGMRLTGDWDSSEKTFLPHRTVKNLDEIAATFGIGNVTLGLVQSLTRKTAEVAIMPGIVFELVKSEITGNPLDVISSYLGIGDVIPVRIYRHPEGKIRLRMDDIDDDETTLPALPIFPGGSAWLEEDREVPWLTTSQEPDVPQSLGTNEAPTTDVPLTPPEVSSTPLPGPGNHKALPNTLVNGGVDKELSNARFAAKHSAEQQRRLVEENARLRAERLQSDQAVQRLEDRVGVLSLEISDLRSQLSEARKQKRAQQASRSTTFDRRTRWASDQDWFNEEIRRAWIGRYKPSERLENYPLNFDRFCFSGEFFASVKPSKLSEEEVRKLVRVVLDIASGRNAIEHKHTVHEKFTYLGGPQESRSDGALLWRVHLESGVPAAKRLHYWQRRDGVIEFGWVANHDDDL
jgi:hypothetical protein